MNKTRVTNPAARDIIRVARAWSHKDDWGVESIYADTVAELVDKLARGADAFELAQHAKHVGTDCRRLGWDVCVPDVQLGTYVANK